MQGGGRELRACQGGPTQGCRPPPTQDTGDCVQGRVGATQCGCEHPSIPLLGLAHRAQGAPGLRCPLVFHHLGAGDGELMGVKISQEKPQLKPPGWRVGWGGCGRVVPCTKAPGSASPNLQIIQSK